MTAAGAGTGTPVGAGAPVPDVDDRLALADGRTLAWCEWGAGDGDAVVLLHGTPGSRWFCPDAATTRAQGVRLVTFDRPGSGASDARPAGRAATVRDVVADLDALLDHLALDRVAVVGWSGGGPFATAYAAARPERVRTLAVVSAPGPLDEVPGAWDRLGEHRRPTAEMARRDPTRSHRAVRRHMAPFVADPASFLGAGRGPDGAVRRDTVHGAMLVAQVREALRPGAEGVAADLVASWLPWGFDLAAVRVPTHVFQGAHDRHNCTDARTYAAQIPGARLEEWPDAGHLGIVTRWADVLAVRNP